MQRIYFAKLVFPELSPDEVVRSARTLVGKPIVFDGRQLAQPENSVISEPISGKVEVVAFIADEELNNLYEKGRLLFAQGHYEVIYSEYFKKEMTFFTYLIISSKAIPSGCRIKLIRREEEMPQLLPRTFFRTS